MDFAIHTNFKLPHQVKQANALLQGFKAHKIHALVTDSVTQEADGHVVLGPHYAKAHWIGHRNVILLDRPYFHSTDNHISVGWMNLLGGRDFIQGEGKTLPVMHESNGDCSLFLSDYNGKVEYADFIRLHPMNKKYRISLIRTIKMCDRATGYNTTALVTAALYGLSFICKGDSSILNDPNWFQLLPYADWSYNDIQTGKLWAHLQL